MPEQRWLRGSLVWIVLIVAVLAMWATFVTNDGAPTVRSIGQVAQEVRDGKVQQLVQAEGSREVQVKYKQEAGLRNAVTTIPAETDLLSVLENYGINAADLPPGLLEFEPASRWGAWLGALTFILPTLLLIGIFVFFMRQSQGSNNQAMSFGKSRARLFTANRPSVVFSDVAGVEEAKEELVEVVEFLKYPEKFAALGARIPRGVLLVGPPGTGRTLLSRAVAGEAGVPFFSISGSEFVEMFVGVGASRVRDLFDQAKRNAPCIVFVDEIDAVGRQRGAGLGGSHDEREQTLNQILVEMDGFDTNTNVIVIAATNRPDILEPALLRPGRFDRQVILDAPDVKGRRSILDVHAKGKPLDRDADLEILAKKTPGFSGADLANLVNESAILAARRNKKKIGMSEFEEAVDRVMLGPARKSKVMSPREKEMVAYHEGGHALVAYYIQDFDLLHKITIVSRGMAGGFTLALPEEDRHLNSKSYFEKRIAYSLGGLAAEELVYGEASTGSSDDLQKATQIARAMVTRYGMSEKLGPRTFGRKEELVFLGREISEQRDYSERIAEDIDEEVRRLVDRAHAEAKRILAENRGKLDQLAKRLIEIETLEGENLRRFLEAPTDQEPPIEDTPSPPPAEPTQPEERPLPQPRPGLAWGTGGVSVQLNNDEP